MSDTGMTSDSSKVLPYTHDDEKPTAEQLEELKEEYNEIKE